MPPPLFPPMRLVPIFRFTPPPTLSRPYVHTYDTYHTTSLHRVIDADDVTILANHNGTRNFSSCRRNDFAAFSFQKTRVVCSPLDRLHTTYYSIPPFPDSSQGKGSHRPRRLNLKMTRLISLVVGVVAAMSGGSQAFAPSSCSAGATNGRTTTTMVSMSKEEPLFVGRRQALTGVAAVVAAAWAGTASPDAASAKYSDYARREKDWEERREKGEVKFSSARDLRAQLQEIAPMNTNDSKIFCPNGPSSNVSPLMENKCGDRLAIPSVYGRSTDAMGNSIPGFKAGYDWSASSSSVSAAAGGFPTYKENEWKIREYK
jgi:hypothetical protein